jgi:RNA polymerase sigma-B factor
MALSALEPVAPLRRRADEHALFRRFREDGDPAIRNALVERFMPLARHLARRYPVGAEREDVHQVAALALVKAVDRFDPDRGVAFTSFATPTIVGEIKRYFRDHGWSVHMPRELQELAVRLERLAEDLTARLGHAPSPAELAAAAGVSVERVVEARATDTAHRPLPLEQLARDGEQEAPRPLAAVDEPGYARVHDSVVIETLLGRLSELERTVLTLRFREDLYQREIAQLLGVSQMQVSRVLTRAMATLRELAEAEDIAPDHGPPPRPAARGAVPAA